MKILFLSQGKKIDDHPGWNDALVKLKQEGYIKDFTNIPYLGYAKKHGWDAFYNKVIELSKNEGFDVVYFHYFHKKGKPSPKDCINSLKKLPNAPIVITSAGDPFSDNWMLPDYPMDFKEASILADITFSTQMGKAADKMNKWGAKNIVYTPNSMCQVRFEAHQINYEQHNFDFDVVFVGSNNSARNPFSRNLIAASKRKKLVMALYEKFGNRLGLFGNGWDLPCAQGFAPFNKQQETFQKGRIIVGGNPYSYSDYYSSNRIFFEISSGIPTVELRVPRLDKVLRNEDHCYFENSIEEIINRCEQLLKEDPKTLYSKAAKAAKYIEEKHTQYHRIKFKIDTVKRYIANNNKLDVQFPFFLPEVDLDEEIKYATRVSKK